jgi:hypothetical protein
MTPLTGWACVLCVCVASNQQVFIFTILNVLLAKVRSYPTGAAVANALLLKNDALPEREIGGARRK